MQADGLYPRTKPREGQSQRDRTERAAPGTVGIGGHCRDVTGPQLLRLLFRSWARNDFEWPLRPVFPSPPSAPWGAVLRFDYFSDAVRNRSLCWGHKELPSCGFIRPQVAVRGQQPEAWKRGAA